jgi:septal ring factor EnvC (AmiA/AmiB activator)
MLARRRTVRHSIELLTERNDEIELLLERFDMLRLHYESDTSRLEGVVEAGTFFEILEAGYCPLCRAAADHQGDSTECEANVSQITSAAGGEIAKIKVRQQELAATIERLRTELESIPARLDREFGRLSQIDNSLSKERPDIQAAKSRIREIMDARADVQTKLEVFLRLDSYKERRKTVAGDDGADSTAAIAATEIPGSIRSEFETKIEHAKGLEVF